MTFKVGDKVRHVHRFREHTPGTVIQVEGGRDGDLTEVYWPTNGDALWHNTSHLEPDPKRTVAEQLDAARSGEEFAIVLNNLFGRLEKTRDEEKDVE